jgi:Flp pilus assembly protein TadG
MAGRRRWVGIASPSRSEGEPGQIVALFAISVLAMVALLGLIIDGGNIYVQRRTTQNAADAATLAGTRALMKASVSPDTTIAAAVCQYLTLNAFGTTPTATATFVGTDGRDLTPVAPITTDAGHTVLDCTQNAANTIPALAAGVKVKASIAFNTYLAGIVGFPKANTTATAGSQGATVTAFNSNNSPFIICGVNTMTYDTGIGPPPPATQSLLLMSGGTPVIPYQIDPVATQWTYDIHDSTVSDCGGGASFKGLADPSNTGTTALPSTLAWITGNRAGPTRNIVDGISGCASWLNTSTTPCVMMVPIADTGVAPPTKTMHAVLWAAFLITLTNANAHSAQLVPNYTVGGGPNSSFTWTWGTGLPVLVGSVGLRN